LRVYYDYNTYSVKNPIITVGVFDGVHKGHQEIIGRLNKLAQNYRGESVVVTFWPHPRLVLKQDIEIKLINTLEEKQLLLQENNVNHLVIIPFTKEFSKLTSDEFVKDILVDKLNVKHLIVGFNHHFGHSREGNFESIIKLSAQYNFTVEKLDAKIIESEKVSSTLIRKALATGDIEATNKYLGYSYLLSGRVIQGSKVGREIGFPTANIKINDEYKIIPMPGVYAIETNVYGKTYPAMLNIGYRPTITTNPTGLTIEAHIIGFEGNIYDKDITIYFKKRIRDEMKFSSMDQLKKQLETDKLTTCQILDSLKANKM
jgi:riboflavin kinase / FMN adenylyltransferase